MKTVKQAIIRITVAVVAVAGIYTLTVKHMERREQYYESCHVELTDWEIKQMQRKYDAEHGYIHD